MADKSDFANTALGALLAQSNALDLGPEGAAWLCQLAWCLGEEMEALSDDYRLSGENFELFVGDHPLPEMP